MVRCWKSLPREAVHTPFLKVFKAIWLELWPAKSSGRCSCPWKGVGTKWFLPFNPNHSMILPLIYLSGQAGKFVTLTSCGTLQLEHLSLWHVGKPGDVSSTLWHWRGAPDSQHRGAEGLYGPPEQWHFNWNWNTNYDIPKQDHSVTVTNNSLNRQSSTPECPLFFTGKHPAEKCKCFPCSSLTGKGLVTCLDKSTKESYGIVALHQGRLITLSKWRKYFLFLGFTGG